MKINETAIKKLADLLNETGLTEIEVAEGEQIIRVSRGGMTVASPAAVDMSAMATDPAAPQPANTENPTPVTSDHPGAVVSPMVGTAYMQSEPGAEAFVKKGATVSAGDTLLIVEAMKVMNPIKAEKGGVVKQILVQDGQPVEFGDVLMIIE